MKRFKLFIPLLFISLIAFTQKDFTAYVNPFIGTGGHGHTYPGASMPFGMMQLSPDTRMADWDGSSGYHYSDSVIYGFSHTHLSGTGIPDYCDILSMPFTGQVAWDQKDYRSTFSHKNEKASPGYYEVLLDKNSIKAQLTASTRSGMHQYIYPVSANTGSVLIDLKHRDQVLDAFIEKVSDYEIRGYRRSRSWARNQVVYFHVQFEPPLKKMLISMDDKESTVSSARGINIKAALDFNLPPDKTLRFKIGISGVSMEGARNNLRTEITGWNFNELRSKAKAAWNRELGKIEVMGVSNDQKTVLYTALYHAFLVPNVYQDVDGRYLGTDLNVYAAKGFTNYSVFSLWDTYRAYHPLMTILDRKRTADWIKTFLAQYQHGGMLPVWELSANETFCMIGYHSVPVITDAWQKGIRNFDPKLALKAMTHYAESERFGLSHYRKDGYLSNEKEHESVSKTLEYAYDDWCIAQFARSTGVDSVYRKYIGRAQNYKNVFDPQTHHMRGKLQAQWQSPFDPREINNFFTEGNSWQYSFAVPQDIETLIRLHAGRESFANKLDELFTTSSRTTGRDQADVTGLIGQYAQGNEPSHHMAYLFNYVRQPWRTQELIQLIGKDFYTNQPDGLIGNEDCGQMSAWYILSAMGIYPVCPGSNDYVLGIPLFDEMTIHLENKKDFIIRAINRKEGINYISSIRLNGKLHQKSYIRHTDLANGGILEFSLTESLDKKKLAALEPPRSVINEEQIIPVPYFTGADNRFRDSTRISIKTLEPGMQIFYSAGEPEDLAAGKFILYTGPFLISKSTRIFAYAQNGQQRKSQLVLQNFFRVPSDKTIQVKSKVHPMYTAGGPEALIDGIRGTVNWRTGSWQSYFDQDFEALIDLQEEKQVHSVGIHVLQDISPWIIFPHELVVSASSDGQNFTELGRVKNARPLIPDSVETQELVLPTKGIQTRYLRIKAVNGGKLPTWHESAGNPSHLFIDEILIR
jgi:predicted alpha-1,2-mannosidase